MKYFWTVVFYMKNGDVIQGLYIGSENSSSDIANKLLKGNDNTFNGLCGKDENHNLLVRVGEIQAIDISPIKKRKGERVPYEC